MENANNEKVARVDDAFDFNYFVYLLVFLNSFKIVANKFGEIIMIISYMSKCMVVVSGKGNFYFGHNSLEFSILLGK